MALNACITLKGQKQGRETHLYSFTVVLETEGIGILGFKNSQKNIK